MSFQPVKDTAVTVDLDKPIQFLGETISSLAIREPTAGDIFRVGNPVINFDHETGAFTFDEKKAFAMLWRLTGIPIEGSLEFMQADDAVACFEAIGPFFVRGLRKAMKAYQEARAAYEKAMAEKDLSSTKPDEPPAS